MTVLSTFSWMARNWSEVILLTQNSTWLARNLDEVMAITQNSTCDSVIVLIIWMTRIRYEVMQITQNEKLDDTYFGRGDTNHTEQLYGSITDYIMYYHGNNTNDIICQLTFCCIYRPTKCWFMASQFLVKPLHKTLIIIVTLWAMISSPMIVHTTFVASGPS